MKQERQVFCKIPLQWWNFHRKSACMAIVQYKLVVTHSNMLSLLAAVTFTYVHESQSGGQCMPCMHASLDHQRHWYQRKMPQYTFSIHFQHFNWSLIAAVLHFRECIEQQVKLATVLLMMTQMLVYTSWFGYTSCMVCLWHMHAPIITHTHQIHPIKMNYEILTMIVAPSCKIHKQKLHIIKHSHTCLQMYSLPTNTI